MTNNTDTDNRADAAEAVRRFSEWIVQPLAALEPGASYLQRSTIYGLIAARAAALSLTLRNGPLDDATLAETADKAGCSIRTIQRARESLAESLRVQLPPLPRAGRPTSARKSRHEA